MKRIIKLDKGLVAFNYQEDIHTAKFSHASSYSKRKFQRSALVHYELGNRADDGDSKHLWKVYRTIHHNNPEHSRLCIRRHENLRSS